MKTKNTYIKFKEWDKESLQKAVDIAEKYWATKWDIPEALSFQWNWILIIDDGNEYYIPNDKIKNFIVHWYTEFEIKIEDGKTYNQIESYLKQKEQLIEFNKKPLEEKISYYCFIPWNGEPVEKHYWLRSAKIEGQRLAKKTWKRVFILQSIKSYKASEIIETNYTKWWK